MKQDNPSKEVRQIFKSKLNFVLESYVSKLLIYIYIYMNDVYSNLKNIY